MPIQFKKQAAASVTTPGVNHVSLFVDSASGLPRLKVEGGSYVELTSSLVVSSVTAETSTAEINAVLPVNVSASAVTVNLPAGHVAGNQVIVKLVSTATNACTVTPNGSELIDGESSLVLSNDYEWAVLVSDGANWMQIG